MTRCSYRRGFSLVELLVVIGVIGLLLGLLLPALAAARRSARGAACLARLAEIGRCSTLYASENDSVVPLEYSPWVPESRSWMPLVGTYIRPAPAAPAAYADDWHYAVELASLHCPEHPLTGRVPGTYFVNGFAEVERPGPVAPEQHYRRISRVAASSDVVWYGELSDAVETDLAWRAPLENGIWWTEFRDVYRDSHVGRGGSRVGRHRHDGTANFVHFDGSGRPVAAEAESEPRYR